MQQVNEVVCDAMKIERDLPLRALGGAGIVVYFFLMPGGVDLTINRVSQSKF